MTPTELDDLANSELGFPWRWNTEHCVETLIGPEVVYSRGTRDGTLFATFHFVPRAEKEATDDTDKKV